MARDRALVAVVGVFALGAFLRLFALLTYSSAVFNYYGGDTTRYLRLSFTGFKGLFSDPAMPAGYPAFLDAMQAISDQLWFTVAVQHALGLATAALLYVALRRIDAPRRVAIAPSCVVLLSGDHLFLEHALLTEAVWTFVFVSGIAGLLVGVHRDSLRWLAAASAIIALSAVVRHLSLVVPLLLAIWACVFLAGTLRARAARASALVLPAAVVIGAYLAAASAAGGSAGLTEMSGFNLYSRVGQFADCKRFEPPPRTEKLCEATPPDERPSTFWYGFSPESPMYKAGFSPTPESADVLGKYARRAILHQPLDYARVAGRDVLKFFAPYAGEEREGIGAGPEQMAWGSTSPTHQGWTLKQMAANLDEAYDGVRANPVGPVPVTLLDAQQAVFRVNGTLLLVVIALAVVGVARARGRRRAIIVALAGMGAYFLLAPPALSAYDVRYGVMPALLFVTAASLTVWSLVEQHRATRTQ